MEKANKTFSNTVKYPPVVTVLGHVDHGKTTLLDAIRKSNIADREHGGITQKIGASKIEFPHEGKTKTITFIDTPGHEAFSLMRERGVQAADIGLLIVSSVDGVKPQTKESIEILKSGNIPFIVVLTKVDLPEKNVEKAKGELVKEEINLEEYGGDVPAIEVSSKTGQNIKELLSLILLVFELLSERKAVTSQGELKGVVIESNQDPKKGALATVVIKNGTLALRDEILSDEINGKIKSLTDSNGKSLQNATVGEAVEIMGFEKAPRVGSVVMRKGAISAEVANENFLTHNADGSSLNLNASGAKVRSENFISSPRPTGSPSTVATPDLNPSPVVANPFDFPDAPVLSLILCADSLGSLEAIINAIPPEINIAKQKTGDITPADVLMAKSLGGIVIGFNTKIKPDIAKLARTEKVLVKNYELIYELIDEIKDVLEGKTLALQEEVLGMAKVIAAFPYEKTKVMGVKVIDGRVAKGDKVRIVRDDQTIGETTVSSLRHGKDQVSKAEKGSEAGVIVAPFLDFTIGDMLISLG